MNLLKTTLLSSISTIVRVVCGLIITKVIAVFAGPAGVAVIGQLQNLINIIMLITGDFLKTAVTKYTAEYQEEHAHQHKIWSSALNIIFCLNIIVFVLFYFYSLDISLFFLKSTEFTYVFKVFSMSLPFFILNSFLLAIINGQQNIKVYITLNIALSVISLALVSLLSFYFGLEGALIAYATNQSVVFLLTIFVVKQQSWFKLKFFFTNQN